MKESRIRQLKAIGKLDRELKKSQNADPGLSCSETHAYNY